MAKNAIDFSTPFDELFAGGGSFFNAGMYRVELSGFGYYDFKKPGNESLCLVQELQPLNADGEDEGDAVTRYWPVGGKLKDGTILVEPVNPIKGRKGFFGGIRFTENNKHDTLHKVQDFAVFIENCHKNGVDMDAVGNDITAFEGNVYEFGVISIKVEKKNATAAEKAEGAGDAAPARDTRDIVVITGVPKKSKAKDKAKKDEDEDEAPAKSKAKKQQTEDEDEPPAKPKKSKGPEGHVSKYVESVIAKEVKKEGSAGWMDHKIGLSKYLADDLDLDADEVKAAMKVWNDREEALPALLTTLGFRINKDKEIVREDD